MEFEKFHLIAVYTPNAGEGLKRLKYRTEEWDVDFFKHLKDLESSGKAVICTGDLNVAHKEIDIYETKGKEKVPGFTPEERDSFDSFLGQGFVDTFRHLYPEEVKYSFWSMRANLRPSNRGWRLDYFLVDQPNLKIVQDSKIHNEFEGSDHCPISLEIDLAVGNTKKIEAGTTTKVVKSDVKSVEPTKFKRVDMEQDKSAENLESDQISEKSRSKTPESETSNLKSDKKKRAKSAKSKK